MSNPCHLQPNRDSERPVVLVVDDDPRILATMERRLTSEELTVLTAPNGVTALELFETEWPDLVLLDISMPGMDGFEVCRRMKSDQERGLAPVLFVSSLQQERHRVRGLTAGADGFLTKPVNAKELMAWIGSRLVFKRRLDQLEPLEAVLLSMAKAIEGRDPHTGGHCYRLSRLSAEIGGMMGMGQDDLRALWQAGVLHDIGKISVPDRILLKPGPLTEEERLVMMEHPIRGEEICRPLRSLAPVLPVIRHHHERLDGSGYPDGLVGDEIPLTARVLQVVDVFDALVSRRPYKPALPEDEALGILNQEIARGWWDRATFDVLQELLESNRKKSGFSLGGLELDSGLPEIDVYARNGGACLSRVPAGIGSIDERR
jgi:cyclic di-GMP phosphodiesterase